MTPNELYAREPEKTDRDIEILVGFRYNHIKEIDNLDYYGTKLDTEKNDRIEIKYYKDFNFDGRRFWRLASVWFDDKPIMTIQNAGREGDDSYRRIITDAPGYGEMAKYIAKELIIYDLNSIDVKDDFYDADEEVEGIDNFYGNSLDGHFSRHW